MCGDGELTTYIDRTRSRAVRLLSLNDDANKCAKEVGLWLKERENWKKERLGIKEIKKLPRISELVTYVIFGLKYTSNQTNCQ